MLKTWLPEREGAEQGHVLVWQGAEPGRATGAQVKRASCPAQDVRHSLPPGTAALESLPAPHLPTPEGESQGLATNSLPSRSFLYGCICSTVPLVLVVSVLLTALALSSRLHKGLGSQEGGTQALVQADPGTPQVDCTFSYLEVQAMALQETPPQVRP